MRCCVRSAFHSSRCIAFHRAQTGTLYFSLNSFDSGADMICLRALDGAEKCAFRLFLRDDETGDSKSNVSFEAAEGGVDAFVRYCGAYGELVMEAAG